MNGSNRMLALAPNRYQPAATSWRRGGHGRRRAPGPKLSRSRSDLAVSRAARDRHLARQERGSRATTRAGTQMAADGHAPSSTHRGAERPHCGERGCRERSRVRGGRPRESRLARPAGPRLTSRARAPLAATRGPPGGARAERAAPAAAFRRPRATPDRRDPQVAAAAPFGRAARRGRRQSRRSTGNAALRSCVLRACARDDDARPTPLVRGSRRASRRQRAEGRVPVGMPTVPEPVPRRTATLGTRHASVRAPLGDEWQASRRTSDPPRACREPLLGAAPSA